MKFSWQKEVRAFAIKQGYVYECKKLLKFVGYSRFYEFSLKKSNKILFLDFHNTRKKLDYYLRSHDLLKSQNMLYSYGILCKSLDLTKIKKLRSYGLGIYTYDESQGLIEISPPDIGELNRKTIIENIRKQIEQINTISSAKIQIGSKIFSINSEKDRKFLNKIISDISTKVYSQEDFTVFYYTRKEPP